MKTCECEIEAIVKRTQKLIDFACREIGFVDRKDISQLIFNSHRKITKSSLQKLAEEYGWGLLEAIESRIGLSYEFYLKLYNRISTRVRSKKDFSIVTANFIRSIISIAETFEEEVGLKPKLRELEKLMKEGFGSFPVKELEKLPSFLAERNVFVIKTTVPALSGLAVSNFIVINDSETKERKLWSLFHELLHLIKGETGFRTVRSPEEKEHEEEIARFFFRGIAPEVKDPLTFEELQKIHKKLNLPVSLWSLAKWYKQKGLLIEYPFIRKKKKERTSIESPFSILFPQEYWEIVNENVKEDDVFTELFGLSYYELVGELSSGVSLRKFLRKNYCYS